MSETDAMVFVVDDDAPMRESLKNLLRSVGLRVELFASPQEFLRSKRPDLPSCLVLDVRLPGLSGLDLQKRTGDAGIEIPIVFITGHGDIPMSVRAMKAGAVEFLTKPFRDQDLLDAIQQALERDGRIHRYARPSRSSQRAPSAGLCRSGDRARKSSRSGWPVRAFFAWCRERFRLPAQASQSRPSHGCRGEKAGNTRQACPCPRGGQRWNR